MRRAAPPRRAALFRLPRSRRAASHGSTALPATGACESKFAAKQSVFSNIIPHPGLRIPGSSASAAVMFQNIKKQVFRGSIVIVRIPAKEAAALTAPIYPGSGDKGINGDIKFSSGTSLRPMLAQFPSIELRTELSFTISAIPSKTRDFTGPASRFREIPVPATGICQENVGS